MRGQLLAAGGRHDLAERDYRRLAELDATGWGHRLLADFHSGIGRLDQAAKALRAGLQAHGDNAGLKRDLVGLLIRRRAEGDLPEADRILGELEKRLGEQADLLWARAALLGAQSAAAGVSAEFQVRRLLERSVELEPTFVRGHVALIDLAIRRRDYEAAGLLAGAAVKANPGSPPLLVEQARVLLAAGQVRAAADLADEILRTSPGHPGAIAVLASAAATAQDAGDLQHLEKSVRSALKHAPDHPGLHRAVAAILDALGRPREAVAALEAYARTNAGSRHASAGLALAGLHRRCGDFREAANCLALGAALAGPDAPQVLIERLRLYGAEGKFDDAASLAARLASADRPDPSVLGAAAAVLACSPGEAHRLEAVRLYRRSAETAPQWPLPKLCLASLLLEMGRADQAESLYREALELAPNDPRALNGLAWILADVRKDFRAALPLADRAAQVAPRDRHVRDTRGVILSALPGRLGEAREEFEKCLELCAPEDPARARALYQLGRVCAELRDAPSARKHLEAALRVAGDGQALTADQRRRIADILKSLAAGTDPLRRGSVQ